MSKRINHNRIQLQKRVASQGAMPRLDNLTPSPFSWMQLPFGQHRGKTLPQILHEDPSYVINYLYEKQFDILLKPVPTQAELRLAHQLEVLQVRAERILPPKEFRDTHDFSVWLDSEGRYSHTSLSKKGRKPSTEVPEFAEYSHRAPLFSYSTPMRFAYAGVGLSRVRGCMMRLFGKQARTRVYFCPEKFFSDRTNFDLSGLQSHTSLAMTENDMAALREKYFLDARSRKRG